MYLWLCIPGIHCRGYMKWCPIAIYQYTGEQTHKWLCVYPNRTAHESFTCKCLLYYCYLKSWLKWLWLSLYFSIWPILFSAWLLCRCRHVIPLICACEGVQRTMPYCIFFSLKITEKRLPNLSSTWQTTLIDPNWVANLVSHPSCLKVFEKSRSMGEKSRMILIGMSICLIRDSAHTVLSHEFGSSIFHRGVL